MKKLLYDLSKILLPGVWKNARMYSEIILKRGPDKYREYTPDFIFRNVLQAYRMTAKLLWPKVWKMGALAKVPKIYFNEKIDPIIAKFPVYLSEFDRIGRNEWILVLQGKTERRIKKKHFDANTMIYIKKCKKQNP